MKLRLKLSRDTEKFLNSSLAVLLMVGVVVLVNALGSNYFARFDLTRDQIYSISGASRDLLRGLDEKVIVKVYFTEGLPTQYEQNRTALADILSEYDTYGGGNFEYEFINPNTDSDRENEAMSYGIQPVQVNVVESDAVSQKLAYMGLAILHEDQVEAVPTIVSTDTLEYDISSAIVKLTRDAELAVGWLQDGENSLTFQESFQVVNQTLSRLYTVRTVTPATLADTELDVLVVAGVTGALSDYALYQIDQALMRGVRLAVLPDPVAVEAGTFEPSRIDSGLADLLADYGVTYGGNLVLDAQSARIQIPQQQGIFQIMTSVEYPPIPYVDDFSDHLITRDLGGVFMAFASSLEAAETADRTTTVLAQSTGESQLEPNVLNIQPRELPPSGSARAYPLALAVQGKFASAFAGEPMPAPEGDAAPVVTAEATRLEETADNRVVVFGTSKFIQDEFLLNNKPNLDFFVNSLDWLTQNEALIGIRSKGYARPTLNDVSDTGRTAIKWGLILGLPALIGVAAVIHFRRRGKAAGRVYHA
jgi:gliding-associated putative ABC transporter substrate-binding component GldG